MTLGSHFKAFRNHWCGAGHRCTVWFLLVASALVLASPAWLSYWRSPWKPAFATIDEGMSMQQVERVMGPPSNAERVQAAPYAKQAPVVRWTYRSPLRMISYSVCFDRQQRVCANSTRR
jgi:hypothetical protein